MFFKVIIDEFFGFRHFSEKSGHIPTLKAASKHKWTFFTTSKTDRHLLCQKVRQRISVMKTNTGVFVVFKTKRQLKCQFSGNRVCLNSFDKPFDIINDDPFLTL